MGLVGKKKQEKKAGSPARSKTVDGVRSIKVLGSGCKACHHLYDNTVKAAEGTGITVEYITDLQKIMEYGAMSMPALVINEKLVSSGKTLKPAEIIDLIKIAANN